MTPDDLISFWSHYEPGSVHPDDPVVLLANSKSKSQFAIQLHALPWVGPLKTAKVFLLFLNPGLHETDYAWEARQPFAEALRENLRGTSPYLYLTDEFPDHPGSAWARRIFGRDIGAADAQHICVVQLGPVDSQGIHAGLDL